MNGYDEDRGFVVSVDFSAPKRTRAVVHAAVEAPMCEQCALFGFCFFDLECDACASLITHPRTTVADLFAVLRQWTPQVQCQLDTIVQEVRYSLLLIWNDLVVTNFTAFMFEMWRSPDYVVICVL